MFAEVFSNIMYNENKHITTFKQWCKLANNYVWFLQGNHGNRQYMYPVIATLYIFVDIMSTVWRIFYKTQYPWPWMFSPIYNSNLISIRSQQISIHRQSWDKWCYLPLIRVADSTLYHQGVQSKLTLLLRPEKSPPTGPDRRTPPWTAGQSPRRWNPGDSCPSWTWPHPPGRLASSSRTTRRRNWARRIPPSGWRSRTWPGRTSPVAGGRPVPPTWAPGRPPRSAHYWSERGSPGRRSAPELTTWCPVISAKNNYILFWKSWEII